MAALEGLQLCRTVQHRQALAVELRLLAERFESAAAEGAAGTSDAGAARRIADAAWQVSAAAERHASG